MRELRQARASPAMLLQAQPLGQVLLHLGQPWARQQEEGTLHRRPWPSTQRDEQRGQV